MLHFFPSSHSFSQRILRCFYCCLSSLSLSLRRADTSALALLLMIHELQRDGTTNKQTHIDRFCSLLFALSFFAALWLFPCCCGEKLKVCTNTHITWCHWGGFSLCLFIFCALFYNKRRGSIRLGMRDGMDWERAGFANGNNDFSFLSSPPVFLFCNHQDGFLAAAVLLVVDGWFEA